MIVPDKGAHPSAELSLVEPFWAYAYERQLMLKRRRAGQQPPWTTVEVLASHRFTNVYRADDRVSQFLIRDVLYHPHASQEPEELVFRAILFRIFNQPGTYIRLRKHLGMHPSLRNFNPVQYGDVLTEYASEGQQVWNNAYMMCGVPVYGSKVKHLNWLLMLHAMVEAGVPAKVVKADSLKRVFQILRSFRLMGDFLAMQFTIDINYSEAVDFSENDFIIPGPGAIRGAQKIFGTSVNVERAIDYLQRSQTDWFHRLGLGDFPLLGEVRLLHKIDIQNWLCEFDKIAREVFPDIGVGPKRIKQSYSPLGTLPLQVPFYPPKWRLQ